MNISFKLLVFFLCLSGNGSLWSQEKGVNDALFVRGIYDHILTEGSCYNWLHDLTKGIGPRFTGSSNADAAVSFTRDILANLDADSVYLQEVKVPSWNRGDAEVVRYTNRIFRNKTLDALALGGSVGTGEEGIQAEVIEVFDLDTLELLGRDQIEGKIVFFNRPMDPKHIRTFNAYGGAVDQRVFGASRAAKWGAKAALVRSMTTLINDAAHTGTMVYEPDTPHKIPGIAISTEDAEELSRLMSSMKVELFIKNNSYMGDSVWSHNVIGEIKGSEFPEEIILVGGHLDSWDVGEGAHDDGAGCVHALQVMETLKAMNYQPKRTIRCVMFMNEENGVIGGREYTRLSDERKEFHLAAIESDAGGFTPRGFSCDADTAVFKKHFKSLNGFLPILENYDLYLKKGGSGADIGFLKPQKGILIGFRPDSQRYFDYHHTRNDVFEAVNERELKLGAAAITSLIYLIDKYGLNNE